MHMVRFPRRTWIAAALAVVGVVVGAVMFGLRGSVEAQTTESSRTTAPVVYGPYEARPLTVRSGIGNFAAKLKSGKPLTVAFLGGPITAGGGDRGLAALLGNWLRVNYPAREVRIVNGGFIDGGSALGAARYDRDILPHSPDLLFVEFAVDDTAKEDRLANVERIVRKAWSDNPTMDLVFLYTLSDAHRDDYRAGKLPPAAAAQEKVAEHYAVPTVALGIDLLARIEAGKGKWFQFFYDAWRPKPEGYAAYGEAIGAAMQALLADETSKSATKHELPAPLTIDLVLRPTTRTATTMPAPAPMRRDDGSTARVTYALPVIGGHWVGSPEYVDADGRVLWRLFTQSGRENGRRLNATFGLDRSRWTGPMQWFEEWGYFTGPAGTYLASSKGNANSLTAREDDLPILTFTAPRAGRYVVRFRAAGVAIWGLHNSLAMNIVHFPSGQTKGTSIGYHRTQTRLSDKPNVEIEVTLAEGDDIAFEIDTNALTGGGGAAYTGIDLTIGWFGN
jgi:lysophospholipase L1-like esterase